MNRAALAFSLLALMASPAAAAVVPTPGAADPRIQTVEFDPDQVVVLKGRIGYQLMIEFAPDERIANVAVGDAAAWQVSPNRQANLLFIKPLIPATTTNLTVVTDLRRYSFELAPGDLGAAGDVIPYVLRFHYPAPPPAAAASAATRNSAYVTRGAAALKPAEVFDDGRFTYFRWTVEASVPAIFVLTQNGEESLVNSAVRDGYVVIEQVASSFILRSGPDQATVVNKAWNRREAKP